MVGIVNKIASLLKLTRNPYRDGVGDDIQVRFGRRLHRPEVANKHAPCRVHRLDLHAERRMPILVR